MPTACSAKPDAETEHSRADIARTRPGQRQMNCKGNRKRCGDLALNSPKKFLRIVLCRPGTLALSPHPFHPPRCTERHPGATQYQPRVQQRFYSLPRSCRLVDATQSKLIIGKMYRTSGTQAQRVHTNARVSNSRYSRRSPPSNSTRENSQVEPKKVRALGLAQRIDSTPSDPVGFLPSDVVANERRVCVDDPLLARLYLRVLRRSTISSTLPSRVLSNVFHQSCPSSVSCPAKPAHRPTRSIDCSIPFTRHHTAIETEAKKQLQSQSCLVPSLSRFSTPLPHHTHRPMSICKQQ
jgi:hypothetical protein